MNLKNSALAAAVTATLALGAAGQASAFVYGAAGLTIDQLLIRITDGVNPAAVTSVNFNFTQLNLASLNGGIGASVAACGGTPLANTCTQTVGSMDAAAANAAGSTINRTNNQSTGGEFTFLGTAGGHSYSNADSQIVTAELVNLGSPTKTHNIAESLLTTGTQAGSTSNLQSVTGFQIGFVIAAEGAVFELDFLADPDLFAQISGEGAGVFSAQASLGATLKLQRDGGGGSVEWAPNGVVNNGVGSPGCTNVVAVTCFEDADSQNLNTNVGTTTNNTSDAKSWDPNLVTLTPFGLTIRGLAAGTWTLTFTENKQNALSRTVAVPEPGVLALMGMGLVGLFATSRRRKQS